MKKIIYIFIVPLTIVIAYLAFEGREMTEIRTEIEIAASPDAVWNTLVEIERWPEWNPIVNKSNGLSEIGSQLDITMASEEKGKDGPQYKPKVLEMNQPSFFRWRAHMIAGFIFTNDKVFELEEIEGGTRLIHKELFRGLLAPIFCSQMEKGVPPMLNKMNQALKKQVEAPN